MSGINFVSILDRPLGKGSSRNTADVLSSSNSGSGGGGVVSLSMFAYMFSEMVQYHQNRVDSISELERRLEGSGYSVGLRVLELLAYRSRPSSSSSSSSSSYSVEYKREIKLMNILQFVSTTVWKSLFGKVADSLERSIDHVDEFMIVDYSPITSTYVSVPADFGGLSVDSYISGIIAGILEGAAFPARVTAHTVTLEEGEAVPNAPLYHYPPSGSGIGGGAPSTQSSSHHPYSSAGGVLGSSNLSAAASAMMYQASYSISELTGAPLLPPRREKTVFLVKFAQSVLARDSTMG